MPKISKKKPASPEKFDLQNPTPNSLTPRTFFESVPLSDSENSQMHKVLEEAAEKLTKSEVKQDHLQLSEITTQIRAIEKQNIILHGERIFKAQQILKKYRYGAFSKWLHITYGNRQTPYRMLQYYDLYTKLEDQEKTIINAMPKRAAYVLASRSGEMDKKIELLKEHHASQTNEIIQAVQEAFPLKKNDKRKSLKKAIDADLLGIIIPKIKKIKKRKNLEKILDIVKELLSKDQEEGIHEHG